MGILIERVSGMRLEEYFRKHIFDPLGVKNISFFPSQEMKGRMAYINRRSPEGVFFGSPAVPMPNQLKETTEEEKKSIFLNGGGGLFGETREYARKSASLISLLLGMTDMHADTVFAKKSSPLSLTTAHPL